MMMLLLIVLYLLTGMTIVTMIDSSSVRRRRLQQLYPHMWQDTTRTQRVTAFILCWPMIAKLLKGD